MRPYDYGFTAHQPHELSPKSPVQVARQRVLDALEVIQKYDTDRDFIALARARYLLLTNPEPANDEVPPPSEKAAETETICMIHTGINTGN